VAHPEALQSQPSDNRGCPILESFFDSRVGFDAQITIIGSRLYGFSFSHTEQPPVLSTHVPIKVLKSSASPDHYSHIQHSRIKSIHYSCRPTLHPNLFFTQLHRAKNTNQACHESECLLAPVRVAPESLVRGSSANRKGLGHDCSGSRRTSLF